MHKGVPVYDMMGTSVTRDRGYPGVAAGASALVELARKVVNLANGDGDAEDVRMIQQAIDQCISTAARLKEKASGIKPLVTEQ